MVNYVIRGEGFAEPIRVNQSRYSANRMAHLETYPANEIHNAELKIFSVLTATKKGFRRMIEALRQEGQEKEANQSQN